MTERWTEAMVAEYQRKMGKLNRMLPPGRLAVLTDIEGPDEVKPKKPSKYRNRKTADGFDSEKERNQWLLLQAAEKAGGIQQLRRQVRFALIVNGLHICDYIADFEWHDGEAHIVADTKSDISRCLPVYRIKKKLMQACYGIEVREL